MSARDILENALHRFAWGVDDGWDVKECTQAILSALAAAEYKIVSREPSSQMRRAADERRGTGHPHEDIWRAMFDAAPPHPPQEKTK